MNKEHDNMTEVTLKPCPNPWCKRSDPHPITRGDTYARGCLVHCRVCGIESPYVTVIEHNSRPVKDLEEAKVEAAVLWNTRASTQADKLVEAAKNLVPYLDWTIGPESPAYHPTMPSAVGAFKHALKEHQEASK